MTEIMLLMGFVRQSDTSEYDAIQSVWNHLQPSGKAEETKGEGEFEDNGERVVAEHLKIFMAAVLGFHIGTHVEQSNENPDLLGTLDETTGEYTLSTSESQKIHKRYHQLCSNRMDHQSQQRREKHSERLSVMMGEAGEPDTHRPKLDKKSLAIIAKQKAEKPGKK